LSSTAVATAPSDLQAAPSQPATPSSARDEWRDLKQLLWLYTTLLASSLVVGLASHVWDTPVLDASLTVFDALVVLGFVVLRFDDVAPTLRIRRASIRGTAEVIGVAVLFVLVAQAYFQCLTLLGVETFRFTDGFLKAGWPVWSIFLMTSLAPAVFEELAFRGVLQGGLRRIVSTRDALLLQAALFSVLHLSPVIFLSHFLMGLAFGWVRERTDSLYPGMLLHASWNAFAIQEELGGRFWT
jgi:membrane protease YdiL (CAAX protease family)